MKADLVNIHVLERRIEGLLHQAGGDLGWERVRRIAQRAYEWRYEIALCWAMVLDLARYLAVLEMNSPRALNLRLKQ